MGLRAPAKTSRIAAATCRASRLCSLTASFATEAGERFALGILGGVVACTGLVGVAVIMALTSFLRILRLRVLRRLHPRLDRNLARHALLPR